MGSIPRSIQSLLHTATPDIADVLGRARFLERIRRSLLEILPPPAAPHVHVAAYDSYRLCLHVTHASWATRLRYMQPAIARALAQRLRLQVDSLEVRVRPPRMQTEAPSQARVVSRVSRHHIRQTAAFINDPELAAAMNRLAAAGRGH